MRAVLATLALFALALFQGPMPLARPASAEATAGKHAGPMIYSNRAEDPWNRVFALLFTRTISASKTDEFGDAKPFAAMPDSIPPYLRLRVSTGAFDRYEEGDRAVEALYPSFLTARGTDYVFAEPARSQLGQALREAIGDQTWRPPLDRALMQADLWSAFDSLAAVSLAEHGDPARRQAAGALMPLFAALIGKVALTDDEIATLPDNYAAGRSALPLPDLFARDGEWMEVVMSPHRSHDQAADFRRASRVFVKPRRRPSDEARFLDGLASTAASEVAVTALVMQTLLVDSRGRVRPTRLVSDVQVRSLAPEAGPSRTDVNEYEVSRRQLRLDPARGGFVRFDAAADAYLPLAGNDYGFATPQRDRHGETSAIVTKLRSRCSVCHGPDGTAFMTFGLIPMPGRGLPPVVHLRQPNDTRAQAVAAAKAERDDFRRLLAAAGLPR